MAGKSSGSSASKAAFGELVRREREAKELGLRAMAKQIGMSAAYLCKIELGDFDPPAEDKVKKIAQLLDHDPDELLALAGRVPSDLAGIIRQRPREMADLLRSANDLPDYEIVRVAELLTWMRGRRSKEVDKFLESIWKKAKPAS
jgi:transcriptional regulator with XRE-family HTH domain